LKPICTRYREENGKVNVELSLRDVSQFFDTRDPSPFREKDLDQNAVEYIVAAAEEISSKVPIQLILNFSQDSRKDLKEDLVAAVHSYFAYEAELAGMRLREKRQRGRKFLVIAIFFLIAFLSLARVLGSVISDPWWSAIVSEGLSIAGWVAMWRPIDSILYEWQPIAAKRKLYEKLSRMDIVVRDRTSRGDS